MTMWKKFDFFSKLTELFFGKDKYPQAYEKRVLERAGAQFVVETMNTRHLDDVMELQRRVYQGETPWQPAAFLVEMHNPLPHLYLVVTHHGKVVAFIGCRVTNQDGHITNLAVDPAYQHRGLALFLLQEIAAFAKSLRCSSLSLEVRLGNLAAQRLYRKFGFITKAVKVEYYTETQEDALDMIYLFEE